MWYEVAYLFLSTVLMPSPGTKTTVGPCSLPVFPTDCCCCCGVAGGPWMEAPVGPVCWLLGFSTGVRPHLSANVPWLADGAADDTRRRPPALLPTFQLILRLYRYLNDWIVHREQQYRQESAQLIHCSTSFHRCGNKNACYFFSFVEGCRGRSHSGRGLSSGLNSDTLMGQSSENVSPLLVYD